MDGRSRGRVLSHLVAGRRLVVGLLDSLGRVVVVSVHRHHGLLGRAAASMEKNNEKEQEVSANGGKKSATDVAPKA